jgi:hypothetical protein
MLFNDIIRTCGDTTKDFVQFFCNKLNKTIPNFGRKIEQFYIANFLHPYYKGSLLKLSGETECLYMETISKIKDLCNNLYLDREKSILLPLVHGQIKVSCKIHRYFQMKMNG